MWGAADGRGMSTVARPTRQYMAVAFGQGAMFATARNDGFVEVWEGGDAQAREWRGHRGTVEGVAFGPKGRLATCGEDRLVRVWDSGSGKQVCQCAGHEYKVTAVTFDRAASSWRRSSMQDSAVRVWDAATGKLLKALPSRNCGLWGVAFSPDGSRTSPPAGSPASSADEGTVRTWDVATGKVVAAKVPGKVWDIAYSPDGATLAAACGKGAVVLLDAATLAERRKLLGHGGAVRRVAFTPDGERIVTAG